MKLSLGDITMHLLDDITFEEITGKKVGVILRSNSEAFETISAETYLSDDRLFLDCVPMLRRKYIIAIPDDTTVVRAQVPNPPWEFGVFIQPNSEAGRFIRSLLDAKIILNN